MYISRLIIYICLDICDYLYFCIMWLFIFDRRLCRLFNWSYMLLRPVEGDRNIYKYMYIFIYKYMYIYIYGLEKKIYKSIFIGCETCW